MLRARSDLSRVCRARGAGGLVGGRAQFRGKSADPGGVRITRRVVQLGLAGALMQQPVGARIEGGQARRSRRFVLRKQALNRAVALSGEQLLQ